MEKENIPVAIINIFVILSRSSYVATSQQNNRSVFLVFFHVAI